MPYRYRPDNAGLNEIARSPAVRAALVAVAEKGKTIAVALSEDFRTDENHPHYADSFEVDEEVTVDWHGRYPGRRGAARLVNTSPHAAAVEWGYRGTAEDPNDSSAHHILTRTAEVLGRE